MKSTLRILFSAASLAALLVMMAPAAQAQCIPAQIFGSKGLGSLGEIIVRVDVTGSGAEGGGNEIGRFWEASNSNNSASFKAGGDCPSTNAAAPADSWWTLSMAGLGGIDGAIGAGTCVASSCATNQSDNLIAVVEDYDANGPPGVGGTAYFFAWRVDPTFPDNRTWNYARVTGDPPTATDFAFDQYPIANVLSSTRGAGVVNTQMQLATLDSAVRGQDASGAIADSATVVSWDICTFHGGGDPGRLRSGWAGGCTPVAYNPDGLTMAYEVVCPNDGGDTYVAIGATFAGGSGGDIASALVGAATQVECDPNLADPDNNLNQRPKVRPKRGVGRSGR